MPELRQGLGAGGRLPGEEVAHGLGPPGQHRDSLLSLRLIQAVGIGEQAHQVGGVAVLVTRVPQLTDSAPPNASDTLTMPQPLWHKTDPGPATSLSFGSVKIIERLHTFALQ